VTHFILPRIRKSDTIEEEDRTGEEFARLSAHQYPKEPIPMPKAIANEKYRGLGKNEKLKSKLAAFISATGLAVVCSIGLVPTMALAAGTTYVDLQLSSNSCTRYAPLTRSCGSGTDTAYKTIAAATAGTDQYAHA
jgi:hypothetical protein